MKDIATIGLYITDFQFRLSINEDSTSVVLLATLFCVEVGSIKNNANLLSLGYICSGLNETLAIVNGLDNRLYPLRVEFRRIICLWHFVHVIQLAQIMNIEFHSFCSSLLLAFAGFLGLQSCVFKFSFIDAETSLLRHDLSQVDWEAESIVEPPDIRAMKLVKAL